MLPLGDRTPPDYSLPVPSRNEVLKRPARRILYPVLNSVVSPYLRRKYETEGFSPNLWLWGQRGNDYERLRRRVEKFKPLRNSDILVAGCGTGRDLESWVKMNPRSLSGIDWFDYSTAWDLWRDRFVRNAPSLDVDFAQVDLGQLDPSKKYDVIGSDAVFEHLQDLPHVLAQFFRTLRPGGLLYATFGPLWYSWGGDHVSGRDALAAGFSHLLLSKADWLDYLDEMGEKSHSEHDGRTWIDHDLFSYLRPIEYLDYLEKAGFERLFVAAIIDPRAVAFVKRFPDKAAILLQSHEPIDLFVSGMTIIYRRP